MRAGKRTQSEVFWLAAVVVIASALIGLWHGREPSAAKSQSVPEIRVVSQKSLSARQRQADEIEQALAQAGCPGWMVLASEGPQALGPEIIPTEYRATDSGIPKVQYPVTLRVVSRPEPPQRKLQAVETPSDPNAADDLLDGTTDLLWDQSPAPVESPPAEEPPAEEQSAEAESQPTDPGPAPVEEPTASQPDQTEAAPSVPEETPPEPEETLLDFPPVEQKSEAPATEQPLALPAVEEPPVSEPASSPDSLAEPEAEERLPTTSSPEPTKPPEEIKKKRPQTPATQDESLSAPAEATPPTKKPAIPDLFAAPPPKAPHSVQADASSKKQATKPQCEFVADSLYPSAFACATCHEKIFDEWRVSSHAYALVSPMFHKFEQTINNLSQGTNGYFCYRCHTPAGTSLGISRDMPLWNLPQVAREGVTCVACHRVNTRYGKVNGERRIEPGDIHAPVYGSIGGGGIAETIARKNEFKVKTSSLEKGPGQDIHVAGFCFDQLSKPDFCVSCHQVAVHPGIKLEVVWEQYRASPACKKGISCQDCHMGRIPGVPSGYETSSAALVNEKSVNKNRKHANHIFYGPGYSIAHPGVFPHNKDALRWSMRDWLLFDFRAGWGTEDFEKAVEDGLIGIQFPPVWAEADDRMDAREIIEDNQKKLAEKRISKIQVMENGSHVDGPFFQTPLVRGQDLRFHYIVTNTNEGHNMPSGSLGAQPQVWANAVLIGPRGQRIWESGYTDRWGDLADIHSEDVRNKRLAYDWQLFNLQTKFLITGVKGTDREFFLPVNVDIDQLPFLRPGAQPISVINHPPFIRMESRSLAPLGSRKAPYKIPGELLREPGCYRLSFRLRMRTQPIYFMRFCNATPEMQRAMNEGITDFHQNSFEFVIR